jgi:alpha-amylase
LRWQIFEAYLDTNHTSDTMRLLIVLVSSCIYSFGYAQPFNVTFRVDMSAEVVPAAGVHIAGNFQSPAGLGDNWNPSSTLMTDANGDKVYEITVSLPPGTYEYKFINGNAWGMDENPPSECSVGGDNNREVTIGDSDVVLPILPFNGCLVFLQLSVNMTGKIVSPEGVHVMGDFQQAAGFAQNWDPASTRMQDQNGDGTYNITLSLPFGTYEYLFVNGNTMSAAETLPNDCTVAGSNGTRNRQIAFSSSTTDADTYCFDSCDKCHPATVFSFDTHWWNDAVFYEIFVRSFYDSDANGIGDFNGMIEKLDYLNDGNLDTKTDLGITGIWLMPMMKSPSYHGYDVSDYYAVEPDYGTSEQFENFLDAAHQRGIKVIIDLVMNHSSSQHPWFTQSTAGSNGYRDWFRWSDNNPGGTGPWGQTIWHPAGGDFYYGLFWSGMPDLNYRHIPVKDEMFNVVDFWLDKNVDGYRLDAIKYLVEDGSVLENLPETFTLLEEFNDVYKTNNPEAFSIGEVWSGTESIVPYVQHDRLDACFEFGLAGAVIDAINSGITSDLEDQLIKVLDAYPQLQYGTFLTNHDIDRVFNAFGSHVDKMKLAASIYLTLPGVPFIYYGEEVGMTGTGADENKRKPMQWSDQPNAGFSTVTPWATPGTNWQTNNVADMNADPNSILSHYRKLIHIRNAHESLRRGQTVLVNSTDDALFGFARILGEEGIISLANTAALTTNPLLSMERSSLPLGEYFVTELLTFQPMGKITINAEGGFTGWDAGTNNVGAYASRLLLLSLADPTTSVEQPVATATMQIMPNPAHDSFEVSINDTHRDVNISIYTTAGVLVFQKKNVDENIVIQTSRWAPGMYIVNISDAQGRLLAKEMIAVE